MSVEPNAYIVKTGVLSCNETKASYEQEAFNVLFVSFRLLGKGWVEVMIIL